LSVFIIATISLIFFSFTFLQKKNVNIYLIGGSTMAAYSGDASPLTGWGMPFSMYFDSTVTVVNRAKSGASTRTFIEEGLWQPIERDLNPGDYVFIHFAHNDEEPTKKSYTPPGNFKANLVRFINETRAKGANPILLTPVGRRRFDDSGRIKETHGEYAALILAITAEYRVPCIDLNKKSQALYQSWGLTGSKFYFNYLAPGENPHFPQGNSDDTHFNELGARKIAELVLAEFLKLKPEMAERIYKPTE